MSILSNRLEFPLLMAPTDTVPTPVGTAPVMGKEDTIEFLGEDDETKEEIDLKPKIKKEEVKEDKEEIQEDDEEVKDEDDEEVDELTEIEAELEEPSEEQLELTTPARRRDILKKYPSLFKDFPYLEKAYYREQQFTELLPTIQDAKLAVTKSETLDQFENELLSGSTESILKAVKEENPRAFFRLVDEYLPTLARVDEKAYHHVLANTIKSTIVSMVQESNRSQNEALKSAAAILNQFVFGTSEFAPPTALSNNEQQPTSKDNELNIRERNFRVQRFTSTRDDLGSRINNVLKNTIEGNIDPKNSMTDYVKRNASRESLETLNNLIDKDSRFKSLLDKLWEKSFQEDFSKTSTDRIRSAYLSKARTLLPSVIKRARNEALKGLGKRVKDDDNEETTDKTDRKGPLPSGRSASSSHSGKIKNAKDIPPGMKTLEFLMED